MANVGSETRSFGLDVMLVNAKLAEFNIADFIKYVCAPVMLRLLILIFGT
jgi:hypothetical protein